MAEYQKSTTELREHLAVLRARKWSIILIVFFVVGAALAASFSRTPIYSATARLLILPARGDTAAAGPPSIYMATEAQLLASELIAGLVKEELGHSASTTALLGALSVSEVADASVLNITFSSTDPEEARDGADSFARNYIAFKEQRALKETEGLRTSVQSEIDTVTEELGLISDQLTEAGGSADLALVSSLEDQRSVLLAQLGVLKQQLNDVAPQQSGFLGGEVIQPAQLPQAPSSPNHIKNGLFAAFLGLAMAIGLAFLREHLDDRVKDRGDAERAVGVPVLATIPWFGSRRSARRKKDSTGLIVRTHPKAGASEAYRNLRTNLQFIVMQRSIKSVLVTSAVSGEGKTVTSCNLAVALAQAGKRVVLVSGDMRRPSLEEHFELTPGRGLSNWLMSEETELPNLIVDPGIPNLRILPSGTIPANPAELLTSINVTRLINTLESNADLVIIDAPPVLPVADATIISSVVGGVLIVLHASSTHRSAVKRAKEAIERAGGATIGAVLNGWDQSASPYYNYDSTYQSTPPSETNGAPTSDSEPRKRSRMRTGSKQ